MSFFSRKFFFIYFFLLLALFVGGVSGHAAQKGMIDDVALVNTEKDLLVYFIVKNSFTEEMEKGIKNGIPVTFTFLLELYQVRKGLADREILSDSFHYTLTYDSLKQIYTIGNEEEGSVITLGDLDEARLSMTQIHDHKLVELAMLQDGLKYKVRVKSRLAKKKLPMNFQYIIPFWQLWKFETDWYEMTFTYGNTGPAKAR